LGGLRALAQTISYEVRLAFILLSFVVLVCRYNLSYFYFFQVYLWIIFISLPLSLIWFISCLAETNRTPFDFAEGESELVSGFNVEYGGGGFALICRCVVMWPHVLVGPCWCVYVALFGSKLYTHTQIYRVYIYIYIYIYICIRAATPPPY
jgi:NADH-ubiquinone oxidoreductase chain 1